MIYFPPSIQNLLKGTFRDGRLGFSSNSGHVKPKALRQVVIAPSSNNRLLEVKFTGLSNGYSMSRYVLARNTSWQLQKHKIAKYIGLTFQAFCGNGYVPVSLNYYQQRDDNHSKNV
jgi:hypothetical protein